MRSAWLAFLALAGLASARIHTLKIKKDDRFVFSIETFGFYAGGTLKLTLDDFQVRRETPAPRATAASPPAPSGRPDAWNGRVAGRERWRGPVLAGRACGKGGGSARDFPGRADPFRACAPARPRPRDCAGRRPDERSLCGVFVAQGTSAEEGGGDWERWRGRRHDSLPILVAPLDLSLVGTAVDDGVNGDREHRPRRARQTLRAGGHPRGRLPLPRRRREPRRPGGAWSCLLRGVPPSPRSLPPRSVFVFLPFCRLDHGSLCPSRRSASSRSTSRVCTT